MGIVRGGRDAIVEEIVRGGSDAIVETKKEKEKGAAGS